MKQHGVRPEDLEPLPHDDPRRVAFRNDDRLVKTLLLSALVPEVESLRGLNAEKLAALNHGTIKTPVPGREAQEVLRRCRNWAASVGEIRIGEESNPTISIQLSGVDTESIIEQARREDNQGNRIRRVRQMLFDQLGIQGEGEFEQFHEFWWRKTKRSCVVLFKNIRELPDSSLENSEEPWKIVIDFPFDEAGHGPRDDLSTLQRFIQSHPDGAKTLCWVPSFFSNDAQKDLGMLVILEHILTGERFGQYSSHLSPQDRPAAKSLLENQPSILRQRVQSHLDAAYGLEVLSQGSLDTLHDLDLSEHYVSLSPGFVPQPPVAANLSGAMQHLLSQALEHEFPACAALRGGGQVWGSQEGLRVHRAGRPDAGRQAGDRKDPETRLSSLCSFRTLYFMPESGPATEGFSCRGAVMNDEGNAARKIRKLRASRDLWKRRSAEKQQEIRQLRVTVRDLSSSRENWKTRVKELEQQLQAAHEAHAAVGPGSWIFFGGLMDNQAMPRTRRTPITLSSD